MLCKSRPVKASNCFTASSECPIFTSVYYVYIYIYQYHYHRYLLKSTYGLYSCQVCWPIADSCQCRLKRWLRWVECRFLYRRNGRFWGLVFCMHMLFRALSLAICVLCIPQSNQTRFNEIIKQCSQFVCCRCAHSFGFFQVIFREIEIVGECRNSKFPTGYIGRKKSIGRLLHLLYHLSSYPLVFR